MNAPRILQASEIGVAKFVTSGWATMVGSELICIGNTLLEVR